MFAFDKATNCLFKRSELAVSILSIRRILFEVLIERQSQYQCE